MEKTPLKVGIIGLGMIGKVHARAFRHLQQAKDAHIPDIQLTILVRPGHQVERDFLDEIGSPKVVTSEEEFFSGKPDLVDICTPNNSHAHYAELACRIHAHIYCEKPIGLNLKDAQDMADKAKKAEVLTHTAFIYRYFPGSRQLLAAMKEGSIGRPLYFRTGMFHGGYLTPQRPITWRLKHSDSGGGALADLGIHVIDLLQAALGDTQWVQCEAKTFIHERPVEPGSETLGKVDVDDWAVCLLGMDEDCTGSLEVSRLAAGRHQTAYVEVFGEKGSLEVDFTQPRAARIFLAETGEWMSLEKVEKNAELPISTKLFYKAKSLNDHFFAAHLASIEDFLGRIGRGEPSPADFETALKDQVVLDAAYRSSQAGGSRIPLM